MKIYPPKLQEIKGKIIISSEFETNNYNDSLWYEFDKEYKEDLVTEQSDAFVVGLLLLALKLKEDIFVVGTISARLKYQLNYYLIPALCAVFKEFGAISIFSEKESEQILSNDISQSATGISCGVDSLATLLEHKNMKNQLKISHLTYFNAGSHSDFGGNYGRDLFNRRYERVLEFTTGINVPLIKIDTNLSELLQMRFVASHTFRNMSCVLNLQKRFKNYYYASGLRFDKFELNYVIAKFDLLTLQMISTESIKFYSSLSDKTREERTMLISNYVGAFQYLDVCVDPKASYGKINCSKCEKCMRTQITLEVLGSLENFREVFDIEVYKVNKGKYVGKLIANKNQSLIDENVLNFLEQNNFKIDFKHKLECYRYRFADFNKLIKRKLKVILQRNDILKNIVKVLI